jgi:double-stranded uracil-DNA glycosylase
MEGLKRSFAAVVDRHTRLLLLGSLPGEESLARGQYYGNPRNQFWRLAGEVIDVDLAALDYEARLAALLAAGVGLWDVVGSATRRGSLDGAIRGPRANDLAALAAGLPGLRAVGFNGGKSASFGRPLLAPLSHLVLIPLPSSSPAFTLPYADKAAIWMTLRSYL